MKKLKILVSAFLFIFISSLFSAKAHASKSLGIVGDTIPLALGSGLGGIKADSDLGRIVCSDDMSQEKFGIGCNPSADGEWAKVGLIQQAGPVLAYMFERRPVSSGEYFADVLDNIGIPTTQKVQAQGVGYNIISPMIPIWKAFRNVAYSLYIIIFAVIGLMIMFRTKVNAQTLVNIQSALPNLIITLVLITFSYAIVGFLIDVMYFLIYFIVYLAQANGLIEQASTLAIPRLMSGSAWTVVFDDASAILDAGAAAIGGIFAGFTLGESIGGLIVEAAAWPIAYLVIAGILAVQMLKLIYILAKAYIMLILQAITAPLQILPNAIPGSTAFMGWLKKTASYLAPFPMVAGMFLLGAIFIGPSETWFVGGNKNPWGVTGSVNAEQMTFPPFILGSNQSVNMSDIMGLFGLIIIIMTPTTAKAAQEALQVKDSAYASELGAAVSAASWPLRGLYGVHERKKAAREQGQVFEQAMSRALAKKTKQ